MRKHVPLSKVLADMSPEQRARVKARAKEMLATQLALGDLRKSRALTQEQVAKKIGGKQVYVSRLEARSDVKISTLRQFVKALGGDLQLLVTFPDGKKHEIRPGKR